MLDAFVGSLLESPCILVNISRPHRQTVNNKKIQSALARQHTSEG